MRPAPLELARDQVLGHRRRVQALDERLPMSEDSLRAAAWAGLQDSMPRAALLSIHARVAGATPSSWEDPSLVQVWGPRFSVFVVPNRDMSLFTLGRFPDDARGKRVATEMAERVRAHLVGRRTTDREVAGALGVGNGIRYATTTGTVAIRWEGARAPLIWNVPPPMIEPLEARVGLLRRYLHTYGPASAASFARWAGIGQREARVAIDGIAREVAAVRTPAGDGVILAEDEPSFRSPAEAISGVRFLPSGDPFFLLHGRDRDLVVADARLAGELWTPRVWPGALLVAGEVAGTWRRAKADLSIRTWRGFTTAEREAVEEEAASLPLPGLSGPITVRWG